MDIRASSAPVDASDVYTDLNSLNNIKNEKNSDEALKKVAQQFESLFVNELLMNMRNANKAFEEGDMFNSSETNYFRDMYDQQMSLTMAKKGIGLADTLYGQMHAQYGAKTPDDIAAVADKTAVTAASNSSAVAAVNSSTSLAPLRRTSAHPYSLKRVEAPVQPKDLSKSVDVQKSQALSKAEILARVLNSLPTTDEGLLDASTIPDIETITLPPPMQPVEVQAADDETENEPRHIGDASSITNKPATQKKSDTVFNDAQEFVDAILPKAQKAAAALGLNPLILVAQCALETGWGKFVVGDSGNKNSHNLFNIKADANWEGKKVGVSTTEFYNGVPIKESASFRAYDSFDESFNDFVEFLQNNPRYQKALSATGNPEQFVKSLHKAGYATDPNYSTKVLSVYRQLVNNQVVARADKAQQVLLK